MNFKLQQLLNTLVPFLVIGIAIALLFGLVIIFSYALVWGLLIGALLWVASVVKQFLFPSHPITKDSGRIIEHNDRK